MFVSNLHLSYANLSQFSENVGKIRNLHAHSSLEAVIRDVPQNKVFLKILQISQEDTCSGVSF